MCVGVTLQCGYGGVVSVCRLMQCFPHFHFGEAFTFLCIERYHSQQNKYLLIMCNNNIQGVS